MATHNDVTGDALVSRVINSNYADNYDRIFRKKNVPEQTTAGDSSEVTVPELRKSERDGGSSAQQPE